MSGSVLVVDDNPTNLKLACDVLEFDGYYVLRATNAEEAEEVLRTSQVDVVLMDLELPGMDGLTLTRKLKADPQMRHLVIIALTAFAMKGDDQRARAAGCDGYLTKPIDTRTFASQVRACLSSCDAA